MEGTIYSRVVRQIVRLHVKRRLIKRSNMRATLHFRRLSPVDVRYKGTLLISERLTRHLSRRIMAAVKCHVFTVILLIMLLTFS